MASSISGRTDPISSNLNPSETAGVGKTKGESEKPVDALSKFAATMFTGSLKDKDLTKAVVAGRVFAGLIKLAVGVTAGVFLAPLVPFTAGVAAGGLVAAIIIGGTLAAIGLLIGRSPGFVIGFAAPLLGLGLVAIAPMIPTLALVSWAIADFCKAASDNTTINRRAANTEQAEKAFQQATLLRTQGQIVFVNNSNKVFIVLENEIKPLAEGNFTSVDPKMHKKNLEILKAKTEKADEWTRKLKEQLKLEDNVEIISQGGDIFIKISNPNKRPQLECASPKGNVSFEPWKQGIERYVNYKEPS